MGFLDDLGKALKDFDNWITDIQMSGEEVRQREVEEYFTKLGDGYWGTEWYPEVEQVYYSQESGMEGEAEDRIVFDYGERYWGKDNEVLGDSDRGEKVPYSEVNHDRIL